MNRSDGQVSFRLTQLLTVRNCFDSYLHCINLVPSTMCSFCGLPRSGLEEDSAYHTLVRCKTFDSDRKTLVRWIETCNLRDLVYRSLEYPAPWEGAAVGLAEPVIGFKEEAGQKGKVNLNRLAPVGWDFIRFNIVFFLHA